MSINVQGYVYYGFPLDEGDVDKLDSFSEEDNNPYEVEGPVRIGWSGYKFMGHFVYHQASLVESWENESHPLPNLETPKEAEEELIKFTNKYNIKWRTPSWHLTAQCS